MDLQIELKGSAELSAKSASFRRRYPRAVLNAMRRAIRRDITRVKRAIRTETGIGASVWGHSGASLNPIVSLIQARVEDGGQSLVTGIKLKGMAKLIEEGGRTRAHAIKPKRGARLVFTVGGRTVFAKRVNHPGSPVRSHGIARAIVNRDTGPSVVREVSDATGKLLGEVFGG